MATKRSTPSAPRRKPPAADPASKADVLLHPVRLRIVQCLAAAKEATPAQLEAALGDVPPASLYRHLKKLEAAELVVVVRQTRVRGTQERTFALAAHQANLTQQDIAEASSDDHGRWFLTFAMGLYDKLSRYLAWATQDGASPDFARDGVGYHTVPLWLTDDEFKAFAADLNAVVLKAMAKGPGENRRLRSFSTVLMPEMDAPADAPADLS